MATHTPVTYHGQTAALHHVMGLTQFQDVDYLEGTDRQWILGRERRLKDDRRPRRREQLSELDRFVVSPVEEVHKRRRNRGGNRQINKAIHTAAIAQISRSGTDRRNCYERCLARGKT